MFLPPLDDGVSITTAFGALWPILVGMGGGYVSLLGVIWKMVQDRNTDFREDIRLLRDENEQLRDTLKELNIPLSALADSGSQTNRALERALDNILPPHRERRS